MENENRKTVKPEKKKRKKRVCEVVSCMTMYSSCVFFYPLRFADLFLPSLPLWMVSGLRDLNRPSVLHLRTFFSFFYTTVCRSICLVKCSDLVTQKTWLMASFLLPPTWAAHTCCRNERRQKVRGCSKRKRPWAESGWAMSCISDMRFVRSDTAIPTSFVGCWSILIHHNESRLPSFPGYWVRLNLGRHKSNPQSWTNPIWLMFCEEWKNVLQW